MASQRLHAAKRYFGHQAGKSPVRPVETGKDTAGFLTWPFYLFEKLMNPWRSNVTSVVSPLDSWRVGNRITVPKSESHETEKAYHYLIELPGVTRDQIELTFKNGTIMLRVETMKDKRNRQRSHRHSHSIRRAFSLPVYTDATAITAELKNGMLTIAIPKTDKPVPPQERTIEVT